MKYTSALLLVAAAQAKNQNCGCIQSFNGGNGGSSSGSGNYLNAKPYDGIGGLGLNVG